MRRHVWAWARLAGAAVLLVFLVRRLGTGPFLDGVRGLGPGVLLAATAVTVATTACSAWRWHVVAEALGVGLSFPAAFTAYYRSQFLNGVLPGGVLGDVHRGVTHGVEAGDLGHGVRSVVWERAAGQVVQGAVVLAVLATLPSPLPAVPILAGTAVCLTAAILALHALLRRSPTSRAARILRLTAAEARIAVLAPRSWPPVVLSSLLVVAGHTCLFLIAARAVGVHAPTAPLLPLAVFALFAAAIPLNVAGWGPREGAAAWAFAAAGLGAGPGVAVATAFGVMTMVATLPGAVVLLADWVRRGRRPAAPGRVPPSQAVLTGDRAGVAEGRPHG